MTRHARYLESAAAALAVALFAAACGPAPSSRPGLGHQLTTTRQQLGHCPGSPVIPARGAPRSLGLSASSSVPPPVWSSRAGHVQAGYGGTAFTMSAASCVLAIDAASGHQLWSWSGPGQPEVMGITAGRSAQGRGIVVVATGHYHGQAPAAVYALTDRLTVLDAATGRELWTMSLPGDGQSIPAAITNSTVIVAEANGTVAAFDPATGARRWTNTLPPGCRTGQGAGAGIDPMATIVTAQPSPTIGYKCAKADEVTAVVPATGTAQWTWHAPPGWSVQAQSPAAAVSGITAFVVSGRGTAAPRRATWTLGPNGYEAEQVVGIDESTGRAVWELDGVPISAGVYGGAGELCVDSPYGVECLNARTGTQSWQWRPVATPNRDAPSLGNDVVAARGRLYLIAPTRAAAKINSESITQRSAPGTFVLRVMDIATGHVVAIRPLPAYYGGPRGVVVSLDSPPGVAAVAGAEVLVTPQTSETDVLEALDMMTG